MHKFNGHLAGACLVVFIFKGGDDNCIKQELRNLCLGVPVLFSFLADSALWNLVFHFFYLSACISLIPVDDAFLPGIHSNLCSVGEVQFAQNVTHVPLDRVCTDNQLICDLAVAQAVGDEF